MKYCGDKVRHRVREKSRCGVKFWISNKSVRRCKHVIELPVWNEVETVWALVWRQSWTGHAPGDE